MKKFLLQATCVFTIGGISCWGNAMQGYCSGSSQCIDNGTNSPTSNNPPTNFGFTINGNGSKTGELQLDILIPTADDPNPSSWSFDLTGTLSGTAKLFNTNAWTSGFLDTYLGIPAQPNNSIGAYSNSGGFFVYQVDFPTATLPGTSHPNTSFLENFKSTDPALPKGSYITGFFNDGTDWVGTSSSGAILVDSDPNNTNPPIGDGGTASTPEPSSIILLSGAVLGIGFFVKRKGLGRA